MPIKTGIGVGEAQVYNTGAIVDKYAKLIQQQQQEQLKYQKQLADSLAKADFKNLHPLDAKYAADAYNEVKKAATNAASITNRSEQIQAASQVQKYLDGLNEYANNAKQWRAGLAKVNEDMLNHPEDYDNESKDEVTKLMQGSYKDALALGRGVVDSSTYKRIPDASLVSKSIDMVRRNLEDVAKGTPGSFSLEAAKQPGWRVPVYKAGPNQLTDLLQLEIASDNKLKYQYKTMYKQMNPDATSEPTDADLANFGKSLYENKYKNTAYRFTGEPKAPKESSGEKLTDQSAWEDMMRGAFGGGSDSVIKQLNMYMGPLKGAIKKNNDGTLTVDYKPMVGYGKNGVVIYDESIDTRPVTVSSPSELLGVLRSMGITGSGSASMQRLGGATVPKSQGKSGGKASIPGF